MAQTWQQLTSGETVTKVITGTGGSSYRWSWFELRLDENNTSHNAVVTVDSETLQPIAGEQVWVRFDVIMVNGTIPGDPVSQVAGPIDFGDPECWIQNEECSCCSYVLRYENLPRITASYGFNQTNPGGLHYPPLDRIIVGVRPSPGSLNAPQIINVAQTSFKLSVRALPRVIVPGRTVIESALAPCDGTNVGGVETCRQYFTVPVSGYDVLQVRLVRTGENLTFANGNSNGGRGFVGSLYVGTGSMLSRPPPARFDQRRVLTNRTAQAEIEYFCTVAPQAGTYTIAVVAGRTADGGFGAELNTAAAELATCALGQCQGVARQGRGRFTLYVRHANFVSGPISGNLALETTRPGAALIASNCLELPRIASNGLRLPPIAFVAYRLRQLRTDPQLYVGVDGHRECQLVRRGARRQCFVTSRALSGMRLD